MFCAVICLDSSTGMDDMEVNRQRFVFYFIFLEIRHMRRKKLEIVIKIYSN